MNGALLSRFAVVVVLTLCVKPVQSLATLLNNARHVCLLDSYGAVQSLAFATMLDEVWEQTGFSERRVAFITTHQSADVTMSGSATDVQQLMHDLTWDACETIYLNDKGNRHAHLDPLVLRETLRALQPSILWVANHPNAYVMRHYMRITGLDGRIQQLCGSTNNHRSVLYVGEGAGALCAGASMTVAKARGDDPKASPEPQFRGLELLGPVQSVSFTRSMDAVKDPSNNNDNNILRLNSKQVYLWSQQDGSTTSLIMNPYQRGALEQFSTSLPPVPPLVELQGSSAVARPCTGEPSMDPSRSPEILRQLEQLQQQQDEGSDYW